MAPQRDRESPYPARDEELRNGKVAKTLAYELVAAGFKLVRDDYDARSFGNRVRDFRRGGVTVRTSKDRSIWELEIAAFLGEFYDIHLEGAPRRPGHAR